MNYFVTAIGTDSGKTVVSAILTEALKADYWKPVQAGFPRDTDTVKSLITNNQSRFYNERYLLQTPASPHAAAKIDKVQISLADFSPPISNRDLVIEGAGGLLVPLNDRDVIADLVEAFSATIILVCNLYLGSINHSLLSIEAIKSRKLSVKGIIFNGPPNPESESIISAKSPWPTLLNIPQEESFDAKLVSKYANILNESWQ